MNKQQINMKTVLMTNGVVDLLCAVILVVVPRTNPRLFGYDIFDMQGALMAGGWGMSTLALGIVRIYASPRSQYHPICLLMGLVEAPCLFGLCIIYLFEAHIPIGRILLPMIVGAVFGALYVINATCFKKRSE